MSVETRVKGIFERVVVERKKQIKRWGGRPAPPTAWFVLVLLCEYIKLIHMLIMKRHIFGDLIAQEDDYLEPMMAVCLLWLEKLDKLSHVVIK